MSTNIKAKTQTTVPILFSNILQIIMKMRYLITKCLNQTNCILFLKRNMSELKVIPSFDKKAREIFLKGVNAVKPKTIFQENKCFVVTEKNHLQITDKKSSVIIDLNDRNCHLVGFGKAVLGMAIQVEKALGDRLVSGIISVPVGTKEKFCDDSEINQLKYSVLQEGAKNNLPDDLALQTALKIKEKVESLNDKDILIIVISGGGSALVPLPIVPITLREKCDLIKALSSKGANINELNTVRIAISQLKGGKLCELGSKAHTIISLIISDIVNDPLELIASGPTIPFKFSGSSAKIILEKYNLWSNLPETTKNVILECKSVQQNLNSNVFVIGNNEIAVDACLKEAEVLGLDGICVSTKIEGDVTDLSEAFFNLTKNIDSLIKNQVTVKDFLARVTMLQKSLNFASNFPVELVQFVQNSSKDICLISGGEPTVKITGNGIGGRNQELALRFATICKNNNLEKILFLSAGTDGIDGPNQAAGAALSPDYLKEMNAVETCLINNDSYNFLKNFNNGIHHIITGHTGTNVMDLHCIIIPRK